MSNTVTAALLIIGDEVLNGKTQDTNTHTIAKTLNSIGVSLAEVRVIPDVEARIIDAVRVLHAAYDYLFTTGGIGPTHDDITAESIAKAFGVPLEVHAASYETLARYYANKGQDFTPPRQKMAKLPQGARAIPNAISAAPGIAFKNIYTMAGVPSIMQSMLQHVLPELRHGDVLLSYGIETDVGESTFAESLDALQKRHPETAIGSYPQFGNDGKTSAMIVLRHPDHAHLEALAQEIIDMLAADGHAEAVGLLT